MAVNHGGRPPRAVIHKRILESAATRPDASVEELAADLAGASPSLVERVLDEYGDPGQEATAEPGAGDDPAGEPTVDGDAAAELQSGGAAGGTEVATSDAGEAEAGSEAGPADVWPELTEKQRRALRAVAERPEATQAELADRLGVSTATVNKRVNAIEGFEWSERRAFVARLFGPLDELAEAGRADEPPGDDAQAAEPPVDDAQAGGVQADAAPGEDAQDQPQPEDAPVDEGHGEDTAADVDDANGATGEPAASGETAAAGQATSDGGRLLDADTEQAVEQLQERVARLEQQLGETAGGDGAALDDAELLAKVVRAVVADEAITAEEELGVLETLLDRPESA